MKSDVSVLQLSKGDNRGMREELAKVDWERLQAGMRVDQQWQELLG